MQKRPFIIDRDTGTDDAIAIIAALYSDEVEVRAITSVNGNVEHKIRLPEQPGPDGVSEPGRAGGPRAPSRRSAT